MLACGNVLSPGLAFAIIGVYIFSIAFAYTMGYWKSQIEHREKGED
jgi:pilus assembly protein TadC